MVILVNVFAIVSAVLFYLHKVRPLPFLISSVLWFFLMVLFWYLLPAIIYRQNNTFRDHFTAELGNTEFSIANNRGERSWKWSSLSNWMESPHFFHLYFNPRSFFIIPKEAFEGDQQHKARQILTEKIKKR